MSFLGRVGIEIWSFLLRLRKGGGENSSVLILAASSVISSSCNSCSTSIPCFVLIFSTAL